MILETTDLFQYAAWFLALIEFILALYILFLNAWHIANRHTSALFLLYAANNFSIGVLVTATDIGQAAPATAVLAATSAALSPALLIVIVALLRPAWLPQSPHGKGRWRWIWLLAYGLAFLPLLLTVLDVTLGTQLWYTGIDEATYGGGYVFLREYTGGRLGHLIRSLSFYLMPWVTIAVTLAIALNKEGRPLSRRLAWLLLTVQTVVLILEVGLRTQIGPVADALLAAALHVLAYAYVTFQQMISERRAQRGRLQPRLTALTLSIAVPLLVAVVLFGNFHAGRMLEHKANEQLETANRALTANVSLWLDMNRQTLHEMVILPDIVSMDPERQKPVLEAIAQAHPHMYLVSTTDLNGLNVARSDNVPPKDYHDRLWFLGARDGAPITYQTLIDRTSGEPALVASMPIRDPTGTIVGVGMFASDLDDVTQEVQATTIGQTGYAYVVDDLDQVLAHPIAKYTVHLQDLGDYPPVSSLRNGVQGVVTFTDDEGVAWQAYVSELENGWGVIVQQQTQELLAPLSRLRQLSWLMVTVGSALLALLMFLTIRQALSPIETLTETATIIAAGDLEREAPVESADEIGDLAQAFNAMTARLRDLIAGLEQQVEERTHDLALRSTYLEATAQVGRVAASILDEDELIRRVVEMIRERFDLYYVGLFLLDEEGQWAVLRAGTGEAGRRMLARGHRIRVGEGMIGWCVDHGEARVALVAEKDAVRLATPELPDTRSEAALPLRSRGHILGAITVQHTEPGAFDEEVMSVLQVMADQVAVALDNARLYTETQRMLEAERRAYGELSRQAWQQLLQAQRMQGYRFAQQHITPSEGDWPPDMVQAARTGRMVYGEGERQGVLSIPIQVRGQVIGVLSFRKGDTTTWTEAETNLVRSFTAQLEAALESARLYQDTQKRAAQDRLLGEVTSRIRETLNMDTVLRTTLRELGTALNIPRVEVRMATMGLRPIEAKGNGNGPTQDHIFQEKQDVDPA